MQFDQLNSFFSFFFIFEWIRKEEKTENPKENCVQNVELGHHLSDADKKYDSNELNFDIIPYLMTMENIK